MIVNFERFQKTTYDDPIGKFANDENHYTGLIFGMSHSQCAIDEAALSDERYCSLAAPSLDIFLHLNFMKVLADRHPEELRAVKRVIIEVPYYIFNYDLSRFGSFVYTKLKYFEIVGDYHNFGKTPEQKSRIDEFRRFMMLFDKENDDIISDVQHSRLKRVAKKWYNKYRVATNKDKVWRVIYEETVQQNVQYWNEFLDLLKSSCPHAKISVLIMPFNPIFRFFHFRQIKAMKHIFLDALGKGDYQVVDHFSSISRDCYFDDHCHLSTNGAAKYMGILKKSEVLFRNENDVCH